MGLTTAEKELIEDQLTAFLNADSKESPKLVKEASKIICASRKSNGSEERAEVKMVCTITIIISCSKNQGC